MCNQLDIKTKFGIKIYAQNADIGPPLGTILGNFGVNATKFSKEFNEMTSDISFFLKLRTTITIFDNNTFAIKLNIPSTGFLVSLYKYEKIYKVNGREYTVDVIHLYDVLLLCKMKLPKMDLSSALRMISGTLGAGNVVIIFD